MEVRDRNQLPLSSVDAAWFMVPIHRSSVHFFVLGNRLSFFEPSPFDVQIKPRMWLHLWVGDQFSNAQLCYHKGIRLRF
ncbi:hypothetical protein AVEN_214249-1, partial [Araneus ventricosus]